MSYLIFLFVIFCCFKKPIFGLALLLQTNIIRGGLKIDYAEPCFSCSNDPDILLGMMMPIIGLSSILFRNDFIKKKIKYPIDIADIYFFGLIFVLFFTSIYACDSAAAFGTFLKFLFLSFGFYFTSKLLSQTLLNPSISLARF